MSKPKQKLEMPTPPSTHKTVWLNKHGEEVAERRDCDPVKTAHHWMRRLGRGHPLLKAEDILFMHAEALAVLLLPASVETGKAFLNSTWWDVMGLALVIVHHPDDPPPPIRKLGTAAAALMRKYLAWGHGVDGCHGNTRRVSVTCPDLRRSNGMASIVQSREIRVSPTRRATAEEKLRNAAMIKEMATWDASKWGQMNQKARATHEARIATAPTCWAADATLLMQRLHHHLLFKNAPNMSEQRKAMIIRCIDEFDDSYGAEMWDSRPPLEAARIAYQRGTFLSLEKALDLLENEVGGEIRAPEALQKAQEDYLAGLLWGKDGKHMMSKQGKLQRNWAKAWDAFLAPVRRERRQKKLGKVLQHAKRDRVAPQDISSSRRKALLGFMERDHLTDDRAVLNTARKAQLEMTRETQLEMAGKVLVEAKRNGYPVDQWLELLKSGEPVAVYCARTGANPLQLHALGEWFRERRERIAKKFD